MPEIPVEKFHIMNYHDILASCIEEVEAELPRPSGIPGYYYGYSSSSWYGYNIGLVKKRIRFMEFLLDQVFPWRDTIDIPFGHLELQVYKVDTPTLNFTLKREAAEYENEALVFLTALAKKLPFQTRIKLITYKW